MLGRLLVALAVAFTVGACGSRTSLLVKDDGTPDEFSQAGAGGRVAGRGGDGAGTGAGRGDSGAGGRGAEGSAGDGRAGMSAGTGIAGTGIAGTGIAGTGIAGFSAGQGGVGGRPDFAGEGGFAGTAGGILNPQGCATPHPFVLSIDPNGSSGSVRGWLESAAGLVFEDQLPRFVRTFGPDVAFSERSIALWWSVASVERNGQGELYFYAGDETSTVTEIAVAHGASRLAAIDIDGLDFGSAVVMAKTGSIVVFRNAWTGEALGLRLEQIVVTDPEGDAFCAAVDASWRFLR